MIKFWKYILILLVLGNTACIKDNNELAGYVPITTMIPVDELRLNYKGVDLILNAESLLGLYITTGVVTSDINGKNISPNQLVIQGNDLASRNNIVRSSAIVLSLNNATDNSFQMGDSLVIDLTGAVLKKENNILQVSGLNKNQISKIRSGRSVAPREVKLSDLYADFEVYDAMLVKIIASIDPLPPFGETLAGDKPMPANELKDQLIYLHTEAQAAFADKVTMPSSDVIGIAGWNNGKRVVSMRIGDDMQNESGPLYNKWPEDFEVPSIAAGGVPSALTSYNSGTNKGIFKTGEWRLYQSILVDPVIAATAGRDKITGKQGIRMQRTLGASGYGVVEMQFDLPHGATKLTYTYGIYYNDNPVQFWLEYSVNGGQEWIQLGDKIDADYPMKTAIYKLDIAGNVRFRIYKPGATDDGRLNIDNIHVFQKTW